MNHHDLASRSRTAIVTGASRGLGLALTGRLVGAGWHVVGDARDGDRLAAAFAAFPADGVTVVPGDLREVAHRAALVAAAAGRGGIDLLVNNASSLGASPQPRLADLPADVLTDVLAVNTVAPLDLLRRALPYLIGSRGCVLNVSSDAAVEAYEGWGAYAASKAALDQLSAVLAVEHPALGVYAVDPGDMATDLHQQAFPGEDLGDLPDPETVAPALLELVTRRLPSGRYRAADLTPSAGPTAVAFDATALGR
ncbi:MAG TPA: SDR family oxidoreductase [Actinomycetales bacterium]|nr:SDR family oxidoreductase [Actinomycetales bacterium]